MHRQDSRFGGIRGHGVSWHIPRLSVFLGLGCLFSIWAPARAQDAHPARRTKPAQAATAWKPLFDGKSLHGWEITKFGGEGDVAVKDGAIYLDFGSPLTGITYRGKTPKSDYELRLEAQRVDGVDFFCALTFPVKEAYCSLIVGGWGGAVVGISSIDGHDASENETTRYIGFKTGRWYRLQVRVRADRIRAWIDDQCVVDVATRGKKLTTRAEVDLSKPLGIATFETRAALRKLQIRWLGVADGAQKDSK